MRTVIFKPILVLMMILSVAFVSINASQIVGDGTVKIELAPGFTIEDIIQDLHDNAMVISSTAHTGSSIYVLHFDAKIVNSDNLCAFLESHPGATIVYEK